MAVMIFNKTTTYWMLNLDSSFLVAAVVDTLCDEWKGNHVFTLLYLEIDHKTMIWYVQFETAHKLNLISATLLCS